MTDPTGMLWGSAEVALANNFAASTTFQDYLDADHLAEALDFIGLNVVTDDYEDVPIIIGPGDSVGGPVHGDGSGSEVLGGGSLVVVLTLYPLDTVDHNDEGEVLTWFLTKAGAILKEALVASNNSAISPLVVRRWLVDQIGLADRAVFAETGQCWASCIITIYYGEEQ